MDDGLPRMDLLGMDLAQIDRWQLLDHMFGAMREGRGGWVVTANLDFLRRWTKDSTARALYGEAEIRVADGMPLVWAARLQGEPCPERVPGSTLVWLLAERAAKEGRSIFLLGGDPGAGPAAAEKLKEHFPALKIAGCSSPWFSNPPSEAELEPVRAELVAAQPDLVLVGLGSPKQEYVIRGLRAALPAAWMMGVGISFSFVAGRIARAPEWVQSTGLEWVHRLIQEPRRLARRYLVEDLPFSVELFVKALAKRAVHRQG